MEAELQPLGTANLAASQSAPVWNSCSTQLVPSQIHGHHLKAKQPNTIFFFQV